MMLTYCHHALHIQLIALGTYIHQIVDEVVEVVRSNLKHRVRDVVQNIAPKLAQINLLLI